MSLFVCMNPNCQCVENTNLVSKGIGSDDEYPNMHLMDMQGYGDEIYVGKVMSYQFKKKDEILLLCSKCNTSVWHNEFPREKASKESLQLAKISKYNAITPMDHPDGTIVKNEDSEWGNSDEYRLATPEELEAYKNSRKKGRQALSTIAGISASLGIDIGKHFSVNESKPQSNSEKKRKMMFAEYKRQWKQAKKDKDLVKVKRFKEKMDSLK